MKLQRCKAMQTIKFARVETRCKFMANQPVANLINVRVQNACKFASSLPKRKLSANLVLNLHTCKRICKFVGNPKLANKGIATVQTNSKFSLISLQRICITCNFLANQTFRPSVSPVI